jgi:hypothetical protein
MQQLTGSFIGSFGPWPGAFETTNCCDVKINCMSDCVALTGCGPNPDVSRVTNTNDNSSEVTLVNEIITENDIKVDSYKSVLRLRSDINQIKVYPNPVSQNEIAIESDNDISFKEVELFDLKGTKVFNQNLESQSEFKINKVELPNLQSGMYILILTDSIGNKFWNKIIKQ